MAKNKFEMIVRVVDGSRRNASEIGEMITSGRKGILDAIKAKSAKHAVNQQFYDIENDLDWFIYQMDLPVMDSYYFRVTAVEDTVRVPWDEYTETREIDY